MAVQVQPQPIYKIVTAPECSMALCLRCKKPLRGARLGVLHGDGGAITDTTDTGPIFYFMPKSYRGGEPPPNICCPITGNVMSEPVIASNRRVYERSALLYYEAEKQSFPYTKGERVRGVAEYQAASDVIQHIREWIRSIGDKETGMVVDPRDKTNLIYEKWAIPASRIKIDNKCKTNKVLRKAIKECMRHLETLIKLSGISLERKAFSSHRDHTPYWHTPKPNLGLHRNALRMVRAFNACHTKLSRIFLDKEAVMQEYRVEYHKSMYPHGEHLYHPIPELGELDQIKISPERYMYLKCLSKFTEDMDQHYLNYEGVLAVTGLEMAVPFVETTNWINNEMIQHKIPVNFPTHKWLP